MKKDKELVLKSSFDLQSSISKMKEDKDNIYIEVNMPGFKKEEISIEINDRALCVDARKKIEEKNKYERKMFQLSEYLPSHISSSISSKATYINGVLKLTLKKDKEIKKNLIVEIK